MIKPPLFIRADACSRMGTGHVMRCIALGQAWQDAVQRSDVRDQTSEGIGRGSEVQEPTLTSKALSLTPFPSVVFICAEIPDALAERVKSEGFDLVRIAAEKGSPEDLQQTLMAMQKLSSVLCPSASLSREGETTSKGWLVLDGYHFDLAYQRGIRAAGIKLLLIDDYNHLLEYEADILLNQNIGAEEIEYRCNLDCRKLLGTQYVMLRREFRTLEPIERNFPTIGTHLLVTLGGADPDNVTLKVIEALQQLNIPGLHVKVIIGPANPHVVSLKAVLEHFPLNVELIHSANMAECMAWADLAVSAAGSTCWELCCMGVPFTTIVLAKNQKGLAAELASQGVAMCLGERLVEEDVLRAFAEQMNDPLKRASYVERGRTLVDGFGIFRALSRPAGETRIDLLAGRLDLRPADVGDMKRFWHWANDPAVRANCYHPELIPLDTHREWFFSKLESPESLILVLELNGYPAGQIRYDACDGAAVLGFSIDPRFWGLGLGRRIVEQSLNRAFSSLGVSSIRAEVFQSNRASEKVFVKTGFELERTCEIRGVPSFVFVYTRP